MIKIYYDVPKNVGRWRKYNFINHSAFHETALEKGRIALEDILKIK